VHEVKRNSRLVVQRFLASGESKSIALKSGGTLTLSASFGFFSLSPSDRAFVFSLIEQLEEYGSESSVTSSVDRRERPANKGRANSR
jgi:hypothetical protein